MKHSRYSTPLRLLLALVALAGLLYWGADTHDRFQLGLHSDQIARSPFHLDNDTLRITSLEPEAAHAGLITGATIESLNGVPYTGQAQWNAVNSPAQPGDVLLVSFLRPNGAHDTARIPLVAQPPRPGMPTGPSQTWQNFALFGLMPLVCMLVGYWVVFAKPDDPNAWFLLFLLLFPGDFFSYGNGLATGGWLAFRRCYFELLHAICPLALLLFAVYFPERSRIDIKLPWLKWAIIGPSLLCDFVFFRQSYGRYYAAGNPPWLAHTATTATHITDVLGLASFVLYLALLFDKSRTASTEDGRRRLRVLLTGTGAGIGALLTAFVLLPAAGYSPNAPGHVWLAYLGSALFLLAPLTLAYVILVQRAMDVRILIRQGTRYALAKTSVWIILVGLMTLVSYNLLMSLLAHQQGAQSKLWQAALFLLLLFLLGLGFRKDSTNWLDRKFFREAYDSELVLSQLSDEVRRYTESGPLLQTVSRCVAETLHVSRIVMLLRTGAEFTLAQSVGAFPPEPGALALTSSTIRRLNNSSQPAQLYRQSPDAWYLLAGIAERQTLDRLGAELLLPLPGRDRLMGIMALGPKQSEAAYSKSDLHLLQLLANQTGMALEVSELAHSLAREAAQRERANREMEIAREVQERLFPQFMPRLPGLSIAGHCRPAQGVGGDYYDVFPLADGRLGLAIGDVSGKGISAALLMASLRASLRGVAIDNPRDFARLMVKVNQLVYESSADNRYATFFFGALDPRTLTLECVNAGHNAPLVLRRRDGALPEILRLEADGPVVGLLPFAPYSEQRLQLAPGDLLVSYTDGISEAMTRHDEEWGEDRMMAAAAIASADHSPADEVLRAIFAQADSFTAGAPQHDDLTLLIVKLDGKLDGKLDPKSDGKLDER